MKKFVFGIALAMVTFGLTTSCSSDDDNGGTTPPVVVDNELVGNVTSNTTLDASIAYELTGPLLVNNGSTLTIPAGTKITASAQGTGVYIAVLKGGKINIEGTADNPVVMSSANANQGDWGGLVICGKASTTAVDEDLDGAQAEIGGFIYGSNTPVANDNSGSIKYLVIKGTGASINPDSQYNGISFYAVGSGTTVENIAVINGADDGVEFFGGSVVAKNVFLKDCDDDAVDWTEGWNGGVENVVVLNNQAGYSTAIEADGDNANPFITNFTAIAQNEGKALQFKKQSGATITNIYLEGYTELVDMKDDGPLANVIVDGTPLNETSAAEASTFQGTQVDYSSWTWKDASL